MHKISGTCLNLPTHRVTRGLRFKINLKIAKGVSSQPLVLLTRNVPSYHSVHWDISMKQNFGDNSPPNMSKFRKNFTFLKIRAIFLSDDIGFQKYMAILPGVSADKTRKKNQNPYFTKYHRPA